MRRLAAGEEVDIETEAPRLEYPQDEAGQVGQAVNTLQRAAVEAAVKQAGMRRGVSEVFVNLARRNQVLLHRQLTLLDHMERRTEDSDELADLFRLDHLTTRMRRHAEGLVILSGAAPSRQWRKPVQLMDVVRAAVAEVEDYERIEVRRLPRLAVDGGAVADLTHLIAELLENATVFSPPHTAVQVLGERVTNGFTLEIHDRGLGMPSDTLVEANLRLSETPEFELSDTDRLGLFVVSRLAQRQDVRVSLQPSPYGGTTAVVLIPGAILTETSGTDDEIDDDRMGRGVSAARIEAISRGTAPSLNSGVTRPRAALDGPVELEAPLAELEDSRRKDTARRSSGGQRQGKPGISRAAPCAAHGTGRTGGPRARHRAAPAGRRRAPLLPALPRDGQGRSRPAAAPPPADARTRRGPRPLRRRHQAPPPFRAFRFWGGDAQEPQALRPTAAPIQLPDPPAHRWLTIRYGQRSAPPCPSGESGAPAQAGIISR